MKIVLIMHNPDEWETVSEYKTCPYHKKYPNESYAGCTCTSSYAFKVTPHSVIDVITNSSTEIYTCTHGKTIEYMKELINSILKAGGSKKKAEDLYEFRVELNHYKKEEAEEYFTHQGMSKEESEFIIKYILDGNKLRVEHKITNHGESEMLFSIAQSPRKRSMAGIKIEPSNGALAQPSMQGW